MPQNVIPCADAPVGSRELAACLIHEFGEVKGAEFIRRELSFEQSLAANNAVDEPPKVRGGFTAKINIKSTGFSIRRKRDAAAATPAKHEAETMATPRAGFVAKIGKGKAFAAPTCGCRSKC